MLNLSLSLSTGRSLQRPSGRTSQTFWPVGLLVFLLIFGPLAYWSGLWNPALFSDLLFPWPDRFIMALVLATVGALFLLPLFWTLWSRRLDVAGLGFAQSGLILLGYFFLDETTGKQGGIGYDTIRYAGLLVILNAIGFFVLFGSMAFSYGLARLRRSSPLELPAGTDERLILVLRAAGLACAAVLVLPMAQSGVVPLLAADSTQARFDIVESSWIRPLYHMGSALLPLVVAGSLVWILRKPARAFGLDGFICLVMVMAQLFTSNRLPLAITLVATLALVSMEFRVHRAFFILIFLGYIGTFTFFSGLTSLWRERDVELGPALVQQSIRQAFIGDNIIDLRDGSWVLSKWDFKPLEGTTYLGGLVSFVPSGLFPQKKDWHLGLNAVRIVGWEDREHFGLRLTFFAESFLNFGLAGVIGLGALMGMFIGKLLYRIHHTVSELNPSLTYHLCLVAGMQMILPLANTSDAFIAWSMAGFLLAVWCLVLRPARFRGRREI